jgi:hypothetical protein
VIFTAKTVMLWVVLRISFEKVRGRSFAGSPYEQAA